MADCGNVIGMHQEELLQEVARVMARPAKPDTEAGKQARHAAKELLRTYGRAGTTAFRAVQQGYRGGSGSGPEGAAALGYPAGGVDAYGYPAQGGAYSGGAMQGGKQLHAA